VNKLQGNKLHVLCRTQHRFI